MGYQESYLTASTEKRFNKILNRVKELGYDFYNEYGTYPVDIITFNKGNAWFKKGQKAIYFVGERYLQNGHGAYRILRYGLEDDFTDEMWEKDPNTEYKLLKELIECDKYHAIKYFTESINPEGIWEDAGKPLYVTHEKFEWDN